MRIVLIVFAAVLGVLFFLWNFVFFVVEEREQAIVVQLGNPQSTVTEPGLYMMIPFIQNVVYFDDRILEIDTPQAESLSSDEKRVVVSAFARYRIVDPLLFYQAVNNRSVAEQRLSQQLTSNIKATVAANKFQVLLSAGRATMMETIRERTNVDAQKWGIEVVDVRIRRADLPQANSEAIFNRMKTAREKEAAEIRAKGEKAALEIRAKADKDATIIVANAERDAAIMRGTGDAQRNKIYADAFSQDPSFFEFYRSMQAYAASMSGNDTTMVLSPDSPFFRYFKEGAGKGNAPAPAREPAPQPTPAPATP